MKFSHSILFFLSFLLCSPVNAQFSLFSKSFHLPDTGKQTLLIAVAPFIPDEPVKPFQKDPGKEFQHKVAEELRADRRMRVVELDQPVSMGPERDLSVGLADVQRRLAQSGADLLIWGTQDAQGFQGGWDMYVSAGSRIQNEARSEGFYLNGTLPFRGIQEKDTLTILDWAVESWRGLIDHSYGMDIAPQIKAMIEKTDEALSLAYEKHWSEATRAQMKEYLTVLLTLYAVKTHDPQTLDRAVSLTSQSLQKPPLGEDPYNWACYENNLGTLLQSKGMKEQSSADLQGAVNAYRSALTAMKTSVMRQDATDIELNLAECLEILGRREGDTGHIRDSISIYEKILKRTYKLGELHQWMDIQSGLGAAYVDLGHREGSFKDLHRAIAHFKQVLGAPGLDGMPMKKVEAQVNLGNVYSSLGGREQSVKEYQTALEYLDAAIPALQGMSSTRSQGIAWLNKGTCQMNLGRLQNNEVLWSQAKFSYSRAASLFALTRDQMEWASIQRDSGILEMFLNEKKMDVRGLSRCLDDYQQEKTVHQKKGMPIVWAQCGTLECAVLTLMGDATGKAVYWTQAKKELEEIGEILDPKTQPFDFYEKNLCQASLLSLEGARLKNPEELKEAVKIYEETLELLKGTDLQAQRCSLQSGLCQALAELLTLSPEEETQKKAKLLLQELEAGFEKTTARVDRALHQANRAQLEAVLARLEKDGAGEQKARNRFEQAVRAVQKEGYVYYGARKEALLGDLDFALAKETQSPVFAEKARVDYTRAKEVLSPAGDYWESTLTDKMRLARSFK